MHTGYRSQRDACSVYCHGNPPIIILERAMVNLCNRRSSLAAVLFDNCSLVIQSCRILECTFLILMAGCVYGEPLTHKTNVKKILIKGEINLFN